MIEINTIYNESNAETMSRMDDNSIDLIVTSPPYNKTGFRNGNKGHSNLWNADMNYDSYNDEMIESDYWKWQNELFNEFNRILKPSGSLFYNHKVRRYKGKAHHPLTELQANKMHFYQQIIWDRGASVDNNLQYLQPTTELILWFVKDKPKVNKNNAFLKTEVWNIAPENNNEHPAPFPLKMVTNCILLATERGDTVYDPFMGSGTTAIACIKSLRHYVGSELSRNYCRMAAMRIKPYVEQTNLFNE